MIDANDKDYIVNEIVETILPIRKLNVNVVNILSLNIVELTS
jgi:hypothetical protein